jgi:hypothetical protein
MEEPVPAGVGSSPGKQASRRGAAESIKVTRPRTADIARSASISVESLRAA